jgi:hypothetical protein
MRRNIVCASILYLSGSKHSIRVDCMTIEITVGGYCFTIESTVGGYYRNYSRGGNNELWLRLDTTNRIGSTVALLLHLQKSDPKIGPLFIEFAENIQNLNKSNYGLECTFASRASHRNDLEISGDRFCVHVYISGYQMNSVIIIIFGTRRQDHGSSPSCYRRLELQYFGERA